MEPSAPVFGSVEPNTTRADACVHEGADAHEARFHGDVERRPGKPIVAERARRFAQHDDLRMRRGIDGADRTVEPVRHERALDDEDRADGHFARGLGEAGLLEREVHEGGVVHVAQDDSASRPLPRCLRVGTGAPARAHGLAVCFVSCSVLCDSVCELCLHHHARGQRLVNRTRVRDLQQTGALFGRQLARDCQ